jgi:hypothetical protein
MGAIKFIFKMTKNTHGVVFAFRLLEISKFSKREIC